MEKVTKSVLLSFVFISTLCTKSIAQDIDIIRPGLIRSQLTISPSYMFSDKQSYFYFHGNLEGYLNTNLSLAGEAYYYLGNLSSENSQFDFNHSIFFGTSWHFIKNNNDLYIGIQPGISITRLNKEENNLSKTSTGINPLFSSLIGYNLFVNKVFHFFIQTRINLGNHNYDVHKNLAEFRISAGLGFNINTVKQK